MAMSLPAFQNSDRMLPVSPSQPERQLELKITKINFENYYLNGVVSNKVDMIYFPKFTTTRSLPVLDGSLKTQLHNVVLANYPSV